MVLSVDSEGRGIVSAIRAFAAAERQRDGLTVETLMMVISFTTPAISVFV